MSNYTKFYCEEHHQHLVFEVPVLYIFADSINFVAKYSIAEHNCGGYITSAQGTLVSPACPTSNNECMWYIEATRGSKLQLEVTEMDIAENDYCNEDFLAIGSLNPTWAIYCGSKLPDDIHISGVFIIRFQCSEVNTDNRFQLKWSYGEFDHLHTFYISILSQSIYFTAAHLSEIVNRTEGVLQSPPITMIRNEEVPFAWRILVERGQLITLHFEEYIVGLNVSKFGSMYFRSILS